MAQTTLKKKIMAATVAMTMSLGTTTVVAPQATAVTQRVLSNPDDRTTRNAYDSLDLSAMGQVTTQSRSLSTSGFELATHSLGKGWCIDSGAYGTITSPYKLVKLTGQSGAYGDSYRIHPDIHVAAINATLKLQQAYYAGNQQEAKKLNFILQGLLGNNLGHLNRVRTQIHGEGEFGPSFRYNHPSLNVPEGPVVTREEFLRATGFDIGYDVKVPTGVPNYPLVKNDQVFNQIKANLNLKGDEYITILLPTEYTIKQNTRSRQIPQRYITVIQPGLNPKTPPTPTPPPVTNVPAPTPTPPAPSIEEIPAPTPETKTSVVTTTATTQQTVTQPPVTVTSVKEQPPVTVTSVKEQPPVTVTSVKEQPPATVTVTKVPAPPLPTVTINNSYNNTVNIDLSKYININGDLSFNIVQGQDKIKDIKQNGQNVVVVANNNGSGNVTVNITNNVTGDTYIQTIIVNDSTSDIWRVVDLKEPKRIPLPTGATWEVTKGGGYVEVERDRNSGQLVILPKPGSNGQQVEIVVTNPDGTKTTHKITIDIRISGTNVFETIYGDFHIDQRGGFKVIQGGDLVQIKEQNGKLTIVPKPNVNGGITSIIVTDEYGVEHRYTFVVYGTITKELELTTDFDLKFPLPNGWDFKVVQGQDIIKADKRGGELVISARENVTGIAVVEIRDDKGNLRYSYTFKVTKGQGVDTEKRTVSNLDNIVIKRNGLNTLKIVENRGGINTESSIGSISIKPQNDQTGFIKIEERTLGDKLVKVYEITVVEAVVDTIPGVLKSDEEARLSGYENIKITSGEEKVTVTRDGGVWVITPREGQLGEVHIEGKDRQGRTTVRYILTIVPGAPTITPIEQQIPDNSATRISINQEFNFKVTHGQQWIDVTRNGNDLVIRPKDGSAGNEVRIEITDRNGVVIGKYIFPIVKGSRPAVVEYNHTIEVNTDLIVYVKQGNDLVPTQGGDLVIIREDNGKFQITPKPGSKGGVLILEERDSSGNIITIHKVTVPGTVTTTEQTSTTVTTTPKVPTEPSDQPSTPPTTVTTPSTTTPQKGGINPNPNTGTIEIIEKTPEGHIIVKPPFPGGTLTIGGTNAGDYEIRENPNGTFTIIRKGGGNVPTNLQLVWKGTDAQGNNITINNVTVNITKTDSKGGSSENMPPECIAAISLLSLPLLVAIPLGILSQVQVPGFEEAHAQLNAAIREINNNIQNGLGIFNEDKAGAAARADDAAAQIAPMIGAVGIAIAAIAAIAGIGYGVLKACNVIPEGESSANRENKQSESN